MRWFGHCFFGSMNASGMESMWNLLDVSKDWWNTLNLLQ
jgi:hypothetical protein